MKIILVKLLIVVLLFAQNENEIVLVDMSGSMGTEIIIKSIKKVVAEYLKNGARVYGFNANIKQINTIDEIIMRGGTNLLNALELIESKHKQLKYLILITDAKVNESNAILSVSNEMKKNGVKICSIYLSQNSSKVPKILLDISEELFETNNINSAFKRCKLKIREFREEHAKKIDVDDDEYIIFK